MIKDRGNIKWGAMMMPEHLDFLKEYKNDFTVQQRELTEWELEDIQQTIEQAYNQKLEVKLDVWVAGKTTQWTGIIKSINLTTNELILDSLLKTKHIPIHSIQSAQLDADYYD